MRFGQVETGRRLGDEDILVWRNAMEMGKCKVYLENVICPVRLECRLLGDKDENATWKQTTDLRALD